VVDRAAVSPLKRAPAPAWLLWIALATSAALHIATAALVGSSVRLPDLELDLQVPVDIELGLQEEIAAVAPQPVVIPEPMPERAPAPERARLEPDEKHTDAGVETDAAQPADASTESDAAAQDAGPALLTDAGPPGTRLPPGAQIALRVDMARIRQSVIADDVRALLMAIPDWKALLDGSEIDPVTQLDRLLIATPNLQREKVVLAGRYVGPRQIVLDAVQKLATAHGGEASWRTARGIRIAPWISADATPRVIALVGPSHFTISRAEDLERLLAIAAARAARPRKGAPAAPATTTSPAEALLAMEEHEGLSLEVDGVAQFVRRARAGVPERLRLSALQTADTSFELRGRLVYADEAAASGALAFWQNKRDAYARNALVALLGLSPVLRESVLERQGDELHVQVVLSVEHTRLIFGYLRQLLGGSRTTTPPVPSAP
jgi:hypothetical protein